MNGFDEGFDNIMFSDDNDMDWRLRAAGLKFKSCKNAAVLFHLDHPVRQADGNLAANTQRSEDNRIANTFICEIGLNTH